MRVHDGRSGAAPGDAGRGLEPTPPFSTSPPHPCPRPWPWPWPWQGSSEWEKHHRPYPALRPGLRASDTVAKSPGGEAGSGRLAAQPARAGGRCLEEAEVRRGRGTSLGPHGGQQQRGVNPGLLNQARFSRSARASSLLCDPAIRARGLCAGHTGPWAPDPAPHPPALATLSFPLPPHSPLTSSPLTPAPSSRSSSSSLRCRLSPRAPRRRGHPRRRHLRERRPPKSGRRIGPRARRTPR